MFVSKINIGKVTKFHVITARILALLWMIVSSTVAYAVVYAAPSQQAPANGATVPSGNVTLTWSSTGAPAYDIGLRIGGVLQSIGLLTSTSYSFTAVAGQSYIWDIASCSANTSYSTANCPNRSGNRSFSAQAATTVYPAPTQLSPNNGAVLTGTSVTISWSNTGAPAYDIGLSVGGVLQNIALLNSTSYSFTAVAGRTYTWDIASCSAYTSYSTSNCPNRSGNRTFRVQ